MEERAEPREERVEKGEWTRRMAELNWPEKKPDADEDGLFFPTPSLTDKQ